MPSNAEIARKLVIPVGILGPSANQRAWIAEITAALDAKDAALDLAREGMEQAQRECGKVLAELEEARELIATKQSGINSWARIVDANEKWIAGLQAEVKASDETMLNMRAQREKYADRAEQAEAERDRLWGVLARLTFALETQRDMPCPWGRPHDSDMGCSHHEAAAKIPELVVAARAALQGEADRAE